MSRRALVGGALGSAGMAALTGCSVSDFTQHKVRDPQAADRALIVRARDLSLQILADLGPSSTASWAAAAHTLHSQQTSRFESSASLTSPTPSVELSPAAVTYLTQATLPAREQALSQELRALALSAQSGEVAALLGSAAAGIDQLVAKGL